VRFLNEEEERQYLAQSPPSNTLLPREDWCETSEEYTPRQAFYERLDDSTEDYLDPSENPPPSPYLDKVISGVQRVNVQNEHG
jgi:hypothetical protein